MNIFSFANCLSIMRGIVGIFLVILYFLFPNYAPTYFQSFLIISLIWITDWLDGQAARKGWFGSKESQLGAKLDPLADKILMLATVSILLIELPHVTGIDARLSRRLLKNIFDYPNHLYLFPPKTIEKMLLKSGFEMLETEKSFSFLAASFARKLTSWQKGKSHILDEKGKVSFGESKQPIKNSKAFKILKNILPGMKLTVIARKI